MGLGYLADDAVCSEKSQESAVPSGAGPEVGGRCRGGDRVQKFSEVSISEAGCRELSSRHDLQNALVFLVAEAERPNAPTVVCD